MPTKEQLSEEINDVLGTNMDFSRMLQDDIELLHELVVTGNLAEPLAKQFVKKNSEEKFEDMVDEWYPGKYASKVM